MFSQAQYEAATNKINQGMADVSRKIDQIVPAAQAGVDHWYIPGFVKDAVLWLAQEAVGIAQNLWNKITDLLKGVAAPVAFFFDAFDWENLRGLAAGVAGEISPSVMPSSRHWTGDAQEAYAKIMPAQSTAATRIATIADSTGTALDVCAAAGVAFYVALGVIVAQFVIAMVGVIAALGSVAFSWAGVGLAVGDTTVSAGLIITAVAALGVVLTAQSQQMVSLHGQAIDDAAFPGGKWPDPHTDTYNYAS